MTPARSAIALSVPHTVGTEVDALARAIATNWLATIGPDVDAFEEEFSAAVGSAAALATSSGTAALHLALRVLGVGPGDEVLVSTLTFCASVNPILYLGARPVLVDAEDGSWNLDPRIVVEELDRRGRAGRLPAAVVAVHLYGQLADLEPIEAACARWGVPLVEDAAESVGGFHRDSSGRRRAAGTVGTIGIFSFDGSKMITTSVGGMLVSDRPELVAHARKLARQAREPVAHYEHTEMGYNYRMSNLLAAVGRVQLGVLAERVAARRQVFAQYERLLHGLAGVTLQPEAPWSEHARWLSCVQLDPSAGIDRERLRTGLLAQGIETRAVWKPMHLQPVYRDLGLTALGGDVASRLFENGLCLPSSSSLTAPQVERVCAAIREVVSR
jgi:dTDP-4-amino-4,6-dideoxygalactose transaminase